MTRPSIHPVAVRGMTLPELMVGLAVGLFVVTIAISTFVSTRTLNVVNSSSTRMTENARLATETLHTDLRSAGFAGCRMLEQRLDAPPVVVLSGGLDAGFITQGNSGVRGFSGTGSAHSPSLPDVIADLDSATFPAPLTNSDVVSMRVPADTVAMGVVASMTTISSAPQLAAAAPGNSIAKGDVVLISNCKASAMFQVTSANPASTGVLAHDTGELIPGNATTNLQHVFRSDATVYRMQTRHYYVAPSKLRPGTGTNSLWRLTVPAPAGGTPVPEEVASGIDRLVVMYGVDTDSAPDLSVNRYLTASAVADWDRVLSARVQLVAMTAENRMAMSTQKYKLDAGLQTPPDDKRLRTVLTEVVTLRNGTP
jgi:type IV pilus assembly protein PilW